MCISGEQGQSRSAPIVKKKRGAGLRSRSFTLTARSMAAVLQPPWPPPKPGQFQCLRVRPPAPVLRPLEGEPSTPPCGEPALVTLNLCRLSGCSARWCSGARSRQLGAECKHSEDSQPLPLAPLSLLNRSLNFKKGVAVLWRHLTETVTYLMPHIAPDIVTAHTPSASESRLSPASCPAGSHPFVFLAPSSRLLPAVRPSTSFQERDPVSLLVSHLVMAPLPTYIFNSRLQVVHQLPNQMQENDCWCRLTLRHRDAAAPHTGGLIPLSLASPLTLFTPLCVIPSTVT